MKKFRTTNKITKRLLDARKSLIQVPVTLYDANNNKVIIHDIEAWCKLNRYQPSKIYDLFIGHGLSSYGYTIVPCKSLRCKTYYFVDSAGTEIEVANLIEWCKTEGFDVSTVYKMARGERKSAYGFRLKTQTQTKEPEETRHDGSQWIQS